VGRTEDSALRAVIVAALCAAFLFTLVGVPAVHADDAVNVVLEESGRITNYFDEYYVVNVDGNISVENPTDRDLYEVQIRYDIGSLAIIEGGSTSYLSPTDLSIPRIPANSTVKIPYNIVGISLTDPALPDSGVLYTGITKFAPVIYSDTFGQLQKANLENESLTGRPGRLISVELRNPTGFQFTINSLRVQKTPTLDPNAVLQEWWLVNESEPLTISPDALFVRDILDRNSSEGQVYWLIADVFISRVEFIDVSNVTRFTQQNLSIPPELLNYTFNETNESARLLREDPGLYVRKFADVQIVPTYTPVTIRFIVNNFDTDLIEYTMRDTVPPGFEFLGGEGWVQRGAFIEYKGSVSGRNAAVPSYQTQLTDSTTAGLDFFDAATITYNGRTTYSDRVRFIRRYVPSQQVYVQKRLRFETDEDVLVTITVQNLGSTTLSNVLLKDYLEEADVFSQISQVPEEKGLWAIASIASGETWEVSYYTTKQTQLNVLPNLFGVPNTDVLRSLVLESVIANAWQRVRSSGLELIGLTLLVGLPIAYFVLKKRIHAQPPSGGAPPSP
jgi:hypothetical protein